MENEPQDTYLPEGDSEALQPFDVREQSTKRGMMWLVGGVVFLLILAFVVLKLFSSGERETVTKRRASWRKIPRIKKSRKIARRCANPQSRHGSI